MPHTETLASCSMAGSQYCLIKNNIMETKLIAIRGNANTGKSTVAACVNNQLVEIQRAEILFGRIIPLGKENKHEISCFSSTLKLNGKKIQIISEGDIDDRLEEQMDSALLGEPDILVICLRSADREGSSLRLVKDKYTELYKDGIEVWTSFSTYESIMLQLKQAIAIIIVNKIVELLK